MSKCPCIFKIYYLERSLSKEKGCHVKMVNKVSEDYGKEDSGGTGRWL